MEPYRHVLIALFAASAFAQPYISGVVSAASYTHSLAPGSLTALFGTKLAPSTVKAQSLPLPYTLNGVSVTVGGKAAPLMFVSAGQINIVIPFDVELGLNVPVVVTTSEGTSAARNISLARNAPALLTQNSQGSGPALAFDGGFHLLQSLGSDDIILYAAGLGPMDPAPASAAYGGAAQEPLNRIKDILNVMIGEEVCEWHFAGLAPNFAGVYQINVAPPKNPKSNRLVLSMNGVESNSVTVPIPVGTNITNLKVTHPVRQDRTGDFTGLVADISAQLSAEPVQFSFDIVSGAKPFEAIGRGPAGTIVFSFDPEKKTWQRTSSTPQGAPRRGDFSQTSWRIYDLMTGMPFPGNVIPMSRFPSTWPADVALLPLPNAAGPDAKSPNGQFVAQGTIASDSHFSIGSEATDDMPIAYYGGFFDLGKAPAAKVTVKYELIVDGIVAYSDSVVVDTAR